MAHPKRRQSKTRTAKRRTHEYHTVCGACGYYRGKLAIEKEAAL